MQFDYESYRLMRAEKCSQEELAELTGISLNIIKNIESGRKKLRLEDGLADALCAPLQIDASLYWKRATKLLTFFNKKGGVGKTSLSCNVAAAMVGEYDKRVLIVDCDSQRNASQSFGLKEPADYAEKNIFKCFMARESIEGYIRSTDYENLDIVIGYHGTDTIDALIINKPYREERFKEILKDVKAKGIYDYIICDTAAALSLFNNIVLRATDGIIIPFEPEAFSMGSIGETMEYVKTLQEEEDFFTQGKNKVNVLGIVVNKYNVVTNISKNMTAVVKELYKNVFKTVINDYVAIKEAQGEKVPLGIYHSQTKSYKAIVALTKEIIDAADNL